MQNLGGSKTGRGLSAREYMNLELLWLGAGNPAMGIRVDEEWTRAGALLLFQQEGKPGGLEQLLRSHEKGLLRESRGSSG